MPNFDSLPFTYPKVGGNCSRMKLKDDPTINYSHLVEELSTLAGRTKVL